MAAARPVIAGWGVRARQVLAKVAGTCAAKAAAGWLAGGGDGEWAGGGSAGVLLAGCAVKPARACWGMVVNIARAARQTMAMLAAIATVTSPRRGPRSRCSASLAETSRTRALVVGSRRS